MAQPLAALSFDFEIRLCCSLRALELQYVLLDHRTKRRLTWAEAERYRERLERNLQAQLLATVPLISGGDTVCDRRQRRIAELLTKN